MSDTARRYSSEFKLDAVQRMESCGRVAGLANELGIRRKFLYLWRDQFRKGGVAALGRGPGRPPGPGTKRRAAPREAPLSEQQKRIAELERLLGIKQMEVDFFKRTFEHVRGVMGRPTGAGGKASTGGSKPHSHSKVQD
jgi:transposase-like protein